MISSQHSQIFRKPNDTFSAFALSPNCIFCRSQTNERHVFLFCFFKLTHAVQSTTVWIFKWKWKLFLFPWFLFASFMPQTCVPSDQKWQLKVATCLRVTNSITLSTSLVKGIKEQKYANRGEKTTIYLDLFPLHSS